MANPNRWLELEMTGGDPWILPVWTEAHNANRPPTTELGQLGIHISIRLDLLRRIAQRIEDEKSELFEAIRQQHNPEQRSDLVFTPANQGRALPVNNDLKYRLIADIDALLFEVDACWGLMRGLFEGIRAEVGRPIVRQKGFLGRVARAFRELRGLPTADTRVTEELRRVLGRDDWFGWLDRNRNFVAHKGTPYVAIDVTNNRVWELLVAKEHPTTFAEPREYFRYSELVDLVRGFDDVRNLLSDHLMRLYRASRN